MSSGIHYSWDKDLSRHFTLQRRRSMPRKTSFLLGKGHTRFYGFGADEWKRTDLQCGLLLHRYHCLCWLSQPVEQAPKGQWEYPGPAGADMYCGRVLRSSMLLFSMLRETVCRILLCAVGQVDLDVFWDNFGLDHANIWHEFSKCRMFPLLFRRVRVVLNWGTNSQVLSTPQDSSEVNLLKRVSMLEDVIQSDQAYMILWQSTFGNPIWSKTQQEENTWHGT